MKKTLAAIAITLATSSASADCIDKWIGDVDMIMLCSKLEDKAQDEIVATIAKYNDNGVVAQLFIMCNRRFSGSNVMVNDCLHRRIRLARDAGIL